MLEINKIHNINALEGLKQLDSESIDCVITSPPYWALRDYGTEGQIGLEKTFEEYIEKLCNIFDEIKRVLKKSGTCWVNIGDTYASGNSDNFDKDKYGGKNGIHCGRGRIKDGSYSQKSLCLIPERFAIEMVNRGWILRNKIVWYKRNSMPSSVKDRFSNKWEHIFLFVKNKKYYFDLDSVRKPYLPSSVNRINAGFSEKVHFNYRVREAAKGTLQQNAVLFGDKYNATEKEVLEYGNTMADRMAKERIIDGVPHDNALTHPLGGNAGDFVEAWPESNLKYELNHNYFSQIDTENKAYWLGFLFADGNIDNEFNRISIELSQKDEYHLQLFKECLKADNPFGYRVRNGHSMVSFRFSSKQIKEDLLKLGLKKIDIFKKIPQNLLNHFIRGLIDGDGWIRFRLASNGISTDYEIGFVNKDKEVVEKIWSIFVNISGSNSQRIRYYKGGYDFCIGGRQQVGKIGEWLYHNSTIYLLRKKNCFPQFVNDESDIFDITTQPHKFCHFAVYPERLCETPIKAGCPEFVCKKCGKARFPITKSNPIKRDIEWHNEKYGDKDEREKRLGRMQPQHSVYNTSIVIGYTDCGCNAGFEAGIVLDPFIGSGTTALVAKRLGRNYIGFELNPSYIEIAKKRLNEVEQPLKVFI